MSGFKARAQGRRIGGFSLRQSLTDQGVTSEEAMRKHLSFVSNTLQANPRMDIARYRVDPNYPNGGAPKMG